MVQSLLPLASPVKEAEECERFEDPGGQLENGRCESPVPRELNSRFSHSPSQTFHRESLSLEVLQQVRSHIFRLLQEGCLSELDLEHLLDLALTVGYSDAQTDRQLTSSETLPGRGSLGSRAERVKRSLADTLSLEGYSKPKAVLSKHELLYLEGALRDMKHRLKESQVQKKEQMRRQPKTLDKSSVKPNAPGWVHGPFHTRLYHDAEYRRMRLEDLQWQTEERERRQKEQKLQSLQISRPRSTLAQPFIERVHIMMERKRRELWMLWGRNGFVEMWLL